MKERRQVVSPKRIKRYQTLETKYKQSKDGSGPALDESEMEELTELREYYVPASDTSNVAVPNTDLPSVPTLPSSSDTIPYHSCLLFRSSKGTVTDTNGQTVRGNVRIDMVAGLQEGGNYATIVTGTVGNDFTDTLAQGIVTKSATTLFCYS